MFRLGCKKPRGKIPVGLFWWAGYFLSDFGLGGVGVFPVALGFVWGFGFGGCGISVGLTTLLPVVPPSSIGLGVFGFGSLFVGLVFGVLVSFVFIVVSFCVVVSVVVCGCG